MSNKKGQKTADVINPGLGDIEKVRDILFGKYVASFEDRFAELEQRLEKDVDQLKQKLVDKISKMDQVVNQSLAEVNDQIALEQANRDNEIKLTQSMLDKAQASLAHSVSVLEDQSNQDLVQLKQNMQQSQEAVLEQIESATQELTKQAQRQQEHLENDKISRDSLAFLLDEVAIKLRGSSNK